MEFYSYTPRDEKPKTLVLKGIHGGYDVNHVIKAINELQLPDLKINKVSKLEFNKIDKSIYHYLVQCSNESKTASLTRQKRLLHQPIKWERLRRKRIFQCARCQQVGHASSNCNYEQRCVRCAGNHDKDAECPVAKNSDPSLTKCANCGENGHPASYGGCPYMKYVNSQMKMVSSARRQIRSKKIEHISRLVNSNIPYANITKTGTENQHIQHQLNNIRPEPHIPTSPSPLPNLQNLNDILNNFKDFIMTHINKNFEEIYRRIDMNARNIQNLCDFE